MRAPVKPLDSFVNEGIEFTFECGDAAAQRSVEVLDSIRRDTSRHAAVCIGFSLSEMHESGELWLPVLRSMSHAGLTQSQASEDDEPTLRSEGLSYVNMFDEYSERPIKLVEQTGPILCDDYELRNGVIFSMISEISNLNDSASEDTETKTCKIERLVREARDAGEQQVKKLIDTFSSKA